MNEKKSVKAAASEWDRLLIKTNESVEWSVKDIEDLFWIEEGLADTRLSGETNQDENEVAYRTDQLMAGAQVSSLQGVAETRQAMASMTALPDEPVPAGLLAAVERTLAFDQKQKRSAAAPSIMVEMVRDQLRVIKSTFQGMVLVPRASVSVRSDASGTVERSERITLKQRIGSESAGWDMHYEILREAEDRVGLVLSDLPGNRPERLELYQNGRRIESIVRRNAESRVQFRELRAGEYDLVLSGGVNHTVTIVVR